MPFGARYSPEATRFRLWAPACEEVELVLVDEVMEMQAEAGGWFGLEVARVREGARYRFRIGGQDVPDPASRFNPEDVGGPSVVVDPRAFEWDDDGWRGRPWKEAVLYELHIGTFTPGGTFRDAIAKLDHLVDLGVTALEVMPVADFPGARGWGYDGVLPFAPDAVYGTPEDFKRFVCECHRRGLMVLLDVVYNHFGPEGNYLSLYAPAFFNEAHKTPWGAAINFDGPENRTVREFFVHNALYWIDEYHLDGLRLDAIHAIADGSPVHIVRAIAGAIALRAGSERPVHLLLENEANEARLLNGGELPHATAQWNDEAHHALHVLLTGESSGYYAHYTHRTVSRLGRSLAEGFAPLPLERFVDFLQNHDQVGNRARGERLRGLVHDEQALRLACAALILSPSIPLLFMGEEFGAATPFLYFCDFQGDLAHAVREGRRSEFALVDDVPDPNAESTFIASKLDWSSLEDPAHAAVLAHYRSLIALRLLKIVPHLDGRVHARHFDPVGAVGLEVHWAFGDGARLAFHGNFGRHPLEGFTPVPGATLMHSENGAALEGPLPAWGGRWLLTAH